MAPNRIIAIALCFSLWVAGTNLQAGSACKAGCGCKKAQALKSCCAKKVKPCAASRKRLSLHKNNCRCFINCPKSVPEYLPNPKIAAPQPEQTKAPAGNIEITALDYGFIAISYNENLQAHFNTSILTRVCCLLC